MEEGCAEGSGWKRLPEGAWTCSSLPFQTTGKSMRQRPPAGHTNHTEETNV